MVMLPQRLGPRHPRLGAAAFRLALPLLERLCRHKKIFRSTSAFASEQFRSLRLRLKHGGPLYLAGIGPGGIHNSGAALVEVTRETGCKIICINEEERFSAEKHSTRYPEKSVAALIEKTGTMGLGPERIDAWFLSWDFPVRAATLLRAALEEAPASLRGLLFTRNSPLSSLKTDPWRLLQVGEAGRRIAHQIGRKEPVPFIAMPHHDNHAWFSFTVSPFAHSEGPVRRSRRQWRYRRHFALPLCRRANAAVVLQLRRFRLAQHFLRGYQFDSGWLDHFEQRGSLHGCSRLWQLRSRDRYVLPIAA